MRGVRQAGIRLRRCARPPGARVQTALEGRARLGRGEPKARGSGCDGSGRPGADRRVRRKEVGHRWRVRHRQRRLRDRRRGRWDRVSDQLLLRAVLHQGIAAQQQLEAVAGAIAVGVEPPRLRLRPPDLEAVGEAVLVGVHAAGVRPRDVSLDPVAQLVAVGIGLAGIRVQASRLDAIGHAVAVGVGQPSVRDRRKKGSHGAAEHDEPDEPYDPRERTRTCVTPSSFPHGVSPCLDAQAPYLRRIGERVLPARTHEETAAPGGRTCASRLRRLGRSADMPASSTSPLRSTNRVS